MTKVSAWLERRLSAVHPAPLAEGERVVLSIPANWVHGARAIGGHLTVTDARLTFTPNVVERLFRSRPWTVTLSEVSGADVAKPGGVNVFAGARVHRLRCSIRGRDELFVVAEPERRAADIGELIGRSG